MKKEPEMGILNIDTSLYKTRISTKYRSRIPYKPADQRKIRSFIPGTILDILVKSGQSVKKGEELMILEAMKMKNILKSPAEGRVKVIAVKNGDKVGKGTLLLELE